MANGRFRLSRFQNPSGDVVWRVAGMLNGQRIRKNFRSRDEATAYRQTLEIEFLNGESEGQTVWTTLTHDQNRDAIAAVNLLRRSGSGKDLCFAVDYFLRHYREAEAAIPVVDAAEAYLEARERDADRGLIVPRQLKAIRFEMQRFTRAFAGRTADDIRTEEVREFLDAPVNGSRAAPTLKTWNNRRGYLSTFLKFCLQRKIIAANPLAEIPQVKIQKARGTAATLSAAEAADFLRWLESYLGQRNKNGTWWGKPGCMVPYFALALFAGVRPDWRDGEMAKLRPEHVRLDTGVILIEPEVSKVNEKRAVTIQPNLRLWLERYPLDEFPIIPSRRFKAMWKDVREQRKLPHDVLRHTYISMTAGAFRSVGDAALQAGNSEAVIRRHYLDLKSVEEADAFWRIVPEGTALPKRMKKVEGRYVEIAGKRQRVKG